MPEKRDVIVPRRSKRNQGIEVTPIEVNKTRRKRTHPSNVAENVAEDEEKVEEENVQEEEEVENNHVELDGARREENELEQVDDVPQQSNTKKRRTRGPTRMCRVAKNHGEKIEVEFNSLGEHVGRGSVILSSFLGVLVREHVPVILNDWRGLDEQTKDTLWEEIQARFNLSEEWQKDCVFKQMGCIWRSSKCRLTSKVGSIRSRQDILNLKPSNIQSDTAWTNWVKSRTTTSFKVVQV